MYFLGMWWGTSASCHSSSSKQNPKLNLAGQNGAILIFSKCHLLLKDTTEKKNIKLFSKEIRDLLSINDWVKD